VNLIKIAIALFASAPCIIAGQPSAPSATNPIQPNVILIFTDDLGYNDIGAFAHPNGAPYPLSGPAPINYSSHQPLPPPNQALGLTPQIDSLASDGVKLTSFYAASPVCTPSRAALLTGSYPTRVRMTNVIFRSTDKSGLNPEEVTLPERLKQAGYTTALVGKWHLGTFGTTNGTNHGMDFHPMRHGFDRFFGLPASNDVSFTNLWDDEAEVLSPYFTASGGSIVSPVGQGKLQQQYLLEALTEQSMGFIASANSNNKPFFLYFACHAPHVPCWPHPDFEGVSGAGQYYDVVAELDHRFGQILDQLDTLGIADNTLVILTSDNGPWLGRPNESRPENAVGSAYPLRGHKRRANEGGPRVPFVARFPGRIPAGVVSDELASNLDLFPTILGLAGAELPSDRQLDGIDLWPLLGGSSSTSPRSSFYYYEQSDNSAVGVRQGDEKLLLDTDFSGGNTGLFDLSGDIQESVDLGSNSLLSGMISAHNNAMSRRSAASSNSNWIEIDTDTLIVTEGGTSTFRVRLHAPANTTVFVNRFSGTPGLTIEAGSALTFTTSNYDMWQTVTVAAAEDIDTVNTGATFRATASGFHLREIFIREEDTGSNQPNVTPESIASLVAWYDAQRLTGGDGSALTAWEDNLTPANSTPNDLARVTATHESKTPASPTLETITLNGYSYRAARFPLSNLNHFELLKAANLVPQGVTNRTVMIAYRGGENNPNSRPAGFGSSMEEDIAGQRVVWNLGSDGNGSSRFDGASIEGYSSGLSRAEFIIRTAVMESPARFSEYINILDGSFTDSQVLSQGVPTGLLSNIRGDFYLGDVHQDSDGGGGGDSSFDILEVLVFSQAISDSERIALQDYLATKYTTDPHPPATPTIPIAAASAAGQVDLSWQDVGASETGYQVQRSTTSGSGFETIHTTLADTTAYRDTGLSPGTRYFYRLVAFNTAGESSPSPEVSVTTWTFGEAWRYDFFGQLENTGEAADGFDSDGDRSSNILERAAGTLPNDFQSQPVVLSQLISEEGNEYLAITYKRLKGGIGPTGAGYIVAGLSYTVEEDSDLLAPWQNSAVVPVGQPMDNGDGTETVTVRRTSPITRETTQFLRLRVLSSE